MGVNSDMKWLAAATWHDAAAMMWKQPGGARIFDWKWLHAAIPKRWQAMAVEEFFTFGLNGPFCTLDNSQCCRTKSCVTAQQMFIVSMQCFVFDVFVLCCPFCFQHVTRRYWLVGGASRDLNRVKWLSLIIPLHTRLTFLIRTPDCSAEHGSAPFFAGWSSEQIGGKGPKSESQEADTQSTWCKTFSHVLQPDWLSFTCNPRGCDKIYPAQSWWRLLSMTGICRGMPVYAAVAAIKRKRGPARLNPAVLSVCGRGHGSAARGSPLAWVGSLVVTVNSACRVRLSTDFGCCEPGHRGLAPLPLLLHLQTLRRPSWKILLNWGFTSIAAARRPWSPPRPERPCLRPDADSAYLAFRAASPGWSLRFRLQLLRLAADYTADQSVFDLHVRCVIWAPGKPFTWARTRSSMFHPMGDAFGRAWCSEMDIGPTEAVGRCGKKLSRVRAGQSRAERRGPEWLPDLRNVRGSWGYQRTKLHFEQTPSLWQIRFAFFFGGSCLGRRSLSRLLPVSGWSAKAQSWKGRARLRRRAPSQVLGVRVGYWQIKNFFTN